MRVCVFKWLVWKCLIKHADFIARVQKKEWCCAVNWHPAHCGLDVQPWDGVGNETVFYKQSHRWKHTLWHTHTEENIKLLFLSKCWNFNLLLIKITVRNVTHSAKCFISNAVWKGEILCVCVCVCVAFLATLITASNYISSYLIKFFLNCSVKKKKNPGKLAFGLYVMLGTMFARNKVCLSQVIILIENKIKSILNKAAHIVSFSEYFLLSFEIFTLIQVHSKWFSVVK